MKDERHPLLIITKSIIWRERNVMRLGLNEIDGVDAPQFRVCEKADLHRFLLRKSNGETFVIETNQANLALAYGTC